MKCTIYNKSLKCATVLFFSQVPTLLESRKKQMVPIAQRWKDGKNGRKVKWESMVGGRRGWRDGIIARVTAK